MKIKNISISQMRQQQAFEFYNRVYDKVKDIKYDALKPFVTNFKQANEAFDIALKPLRKSLVTEKISKADERRDAAWRGLKAAVQLNLNHFRDHEKDLAKQADRILSTYGDPTKLPYTEETGVLRNLITDLYNHIKPGHITDLGIGAWLAELNSANTAFSDLVKERNSEQASLISGESKAKRREVDEAYKKLVEMVNAFALVAENPSVFADAIQKVNQIIDKESAVLKARRTRSNNKNNNEEPDDTQPAD